MNSVTLILSVSVIILLIYIIFSLLRRNAYTGAIAYANKERNVTVSQNYSPASAYSIWIYISEWTHGEKNIFERGEINVGLDNTRNYLTVTVPEIINMQYKNNPSYYIKYTEDDAKLYHYGTNDNCKLLCSNDETCGGFNYYKNPQKDMTFSNETNLTTTGCVLVNRAPLTSLDLTESESNDILYSEIKNSNNKTYIVETYIPIQEWVFITINMDSQYTEVYINGKMVKTIINTNKTNTETNVYLSKSDTGFNGYNSKFQSFDKTLTTQEIWNSYKAGFGYYSSLSDYSVKIGFYKDDV